jgi:hypothetical protein
MKKLLLYLILPLYLAATVVYASDMTSTDFIIRSPEIGTGGTFGSSTSYQLYSAGNVNVSGTAGSSTSYQLKDGFLQFPLAQAGTVTANVTGSEIDVSWPATTVADGYTVGSYNLGISTTNGGPYTYTSLSNTTLSYSYLNEVPGTYYFVLQTLDAYGNVIATSAQVSATVQVVVTFSVSNNSLSFGSLIASGTRYATTSGGSGTLTSGNALTASSNSSSGYTLSYQGSTLTNGSNTINPATISGSNTGTNGTNQFALSLLASGTATVPTTYDQTSQNWNFAQNTLSQIASTSGPSGVATLNAYYLANAAASAAAGNYSTVVTYIMTANF